MNFSFILEHTNINVLKKEISNVIGEQETLTDGVIEALLKDLKSNSE